MATQIGETYFHTEYRDDELCANISRDGDYVSIPEIEIPILISYLSAMISKLEE